VGTCMVGGGEGGREGGWIWGREDEDEGVMIEEEIGWGHGWWSGMAFKR